MGDVIGNPNTWHQRNPPLDPRLAEMIRCGTVTDGSRKQLAELRYRAAEQIIQEERYDMTREDAEQFVNAELALRRQREQLAAPLGLPFGGMDLSAKGVQAWRDRRFSSQADMHAGAGYSINPWPVWAKGLLWYALMCAGMGVISATSVHLTG